MPPELAPSFAAADIERAYRLLGYWIIAKPLNPSVKILGDAEQHVRGSVSALFRFTSVEGGRGGIAVCAERVE